MRFKLAAVWILLQVAFFAGWIAREESRLAEGEGQSILVRTAPVDPRDFLSGQYIRLAYEFGSWRFVRQADLPPDGSTVWVVLRPQGEFHVPVEIRRERPAGLPPGRVAVRGIVDGGTLRFGIERYFVPEGTETPNQRDITVRLRVGRDGRPRIEEVYVRGRPWP